MLKAIAHPTDFSPASTIAYAHALRLALHFKCRLELLHVKRKGEDADWGAFPHVRDTLHQWGLLPADATHADILTKLNLTVRKAEVTHSDVAAGVAAYVHQHECDILVVATHGREGVNRWLSGSVSEDIAHKTRLPALYVGPHARPFADPQTGTLHLKSVLLPVAAQPDPARAFAHIEDLFGSLAPQWHAIHVGEATPAVRSKRSGPLTVEVLRGGIVEAILKAAETRRADLIAMPTEGRHGFLDALRGSTTEQVVHRAPCPVLAIPS